MIINNQSRIIIPEYRLGICSFVYVCGIFSKIQLDHPKNSKLRRQLLVANGLRSGRQLPDQLFQSADHADHAALIEVTLIP